jgi:hypothetical protein
LNLSQYADSGNEIAFILHKVTDELGTSIRIDEVKDGDGLVLEYKLFVDIPVGNKILFLEISDSQKSAFIING